MSSGCALLRCRNRCSIGCAGRLSRQQRTRFSWRAIPELFRLSVLGSSAPGHLADPEHAARTSSLEAGDTSAGPLALVNKQQPEDVFGGATSSLRISAARLELDFFLARPHRTTLGGASFRQQRSASHSSQRCSLEPRLRLVNSAASLPGRASRPRPSRMLPTWCHPSLARRLSGGTRPRSHGARSRRRSPSRPQLSTPRSLNVA